MNDYRVRVECVMEGWVEVSADSEEEARRYIPEGVSSGDLQFNGDCVSIIPHEIKLTKDGTQATDDRGAFATGVMPEIPIEASREPAAPPAGGE